MKPFFLRIWIVFTAVLLQISFLNLIFTDRYAVNVAMLTAIAWIIAAKFEKVWLWIVGLGFLMDIFLGDRIGPNILALILFSYLVTFVSKRFLIERRFSGFLVVIIFIVASSLGGYLLNFIFSDGAILRELPTVVEKYFLDWNRLVWGNVLGGIYFYFIYSVINKIEKYISNYEKRALTPF